MSEPKFPGAPPLSASAVLELVALQGIPVEDAAMAERIAAGAHAAATAVRTVAHTVDATALFEREPAEYLAVLEKLAAPDRP
jgi:hypothetical protein